MMVACSLWPGSCAQMVTQTQIWRQMGWPLPPPVVSTNAVTSSQFGFLLVSQSVWEQPDRPLKRASVVKLLQPLPSGRTTKRRRCCAGWRKRSGLRYKNRPRIRQAVPPQVLYYFESCNRLCCAGLPILYACMYVVRQNATTSSTGRRLLFFCMVGRRRNSGQPHLTSVALGSMEPRFLQVSWLVVWGWWTKDLEHHSSGQTCFIVLEHRTIRGTVHQCWGARKGGALREFLILLKEVGDTQEAAWHFLTAMGGHCPRNGRMQRGGSSVPIPARHLEELRLLMLGGQSLKVAPWGLQEDLVDSIHLFLRCHCLIVGELDLLQQILLSQQEY